MTEDGTPSRFSGRDLDCVRGGRKVFARLQFTLAEGGALLLLGPNGSGKSSLLRVMAGLTRPAAGKLCWNGQAIDEDREAHGRRIVYIGHLDAIKPALSVRENLRFWAGLHGDKATTENRLDVGLAALNLSALAETPAKYLSAGQKRRLNLARLVARPASLWLLDEPTVGLDKASLAAIEGLLAKHRAQGGMVALSTHSAVALEDAQTLQLDHFAPSRGELAGIWA